MFGVILGVALRLLLSDVLCCVMIVVDYVWVSFRLIVIVNSVGHYTYCGLYAYCWFVMLCIAFDLMLYLRFFVTV